MKFKNIKKSPSTGGKKKKSPSNSRTIAEHFKFSWPKISHIALFKVYRKTLKIFVVFIFMVAVIIVGIDLRDNLKVSQKLDPQRESLIRDLSFWEDFLSKHKNYRDAYLQASILEYKLGNTAKAKKYIEKGLILDPNSITGRKIEEFLKSKFYF